MGGSATAKPGSRAAFFLLRLGSVAPVLLKNGSKADVQALTLLPACTLRLGQTGNRHRLPLVPLLSNESTRQVTGFLLEGWAFEVS